MAIAVLIYAQRREEQLTLFVDIGVPKFSNAVGHNSTVGSLISVAFLNLVTLMTGKISRLLEQAVRSFHR